MIDGADAHIGAIDVRVRMPRNYSPSQRVALERAAGTCPIKHSFRAGTTISTHFEFPGA